MLSILSKAGGKIPPLINCQIIIQETTGVGKRKYLPRRHKKAPAVPGRCLRKYGPLRRRREPSYNLHPSPQVGCLQLALLLPTSGRKGSREACKPRTDPTSPITNVRIKKTHHTPRRGAHLCAHRYFTRLAGKRKGVFCKKVQEFSSSSARNCSVKRSYTVLSSSSLSRVERSSSPFSVTLLRITRP